MMVQGKIHHEPLALFRSPYVTDKLLMRTDLSHREATRFHAASVAESDASLTPFSDYSGTTEELMWR
jgi:hypothetical protein